MARTKQAARDKSWEEKQKAKRAAAVQRLAKAKAGDDIEAFARAWFEALRQGTPGQLRDEFEALLREAPIGRATEATTELLGMVAALLRRNNERENERRRQCNDEREKAKAARQQFKDAKEGDDIEAFARAWFEALRQGTPGQLRDEFEALLREAPIGRATEATTELLGMVEAVLRRNRECVKAHYNSGRERPARKQAKAAREAAFQQFEDAKEGDDIEAFALAYFEALRHATPGQLRDEFYAFLREAPDGRATEATTELLAMVEALLLRKNPKRARAKTVRQAAFQQFEDAKEGDDIEAFALAYFEALRHATPGQLRDEFYAFLREAPAGRATEALTELLDMVTAHLRLHAERNNARKRPQLHRRLRAVVVEGKVLDVPTYINEKRAAVIASIDDEVACCVEINQ